MKGVGQRGGHMGTGGAHTGASGVTGKASISGTEAVQQLASGY